jgi:hypothetical protein
MMTDFFHRPNTNDLLTISSTLILIGCSISCICMIRHFMVLHGFGGWVLFSGTNPELRQVKRLPYLNFSTFPSLTWIPFGRLFIL